MKINQNPRVLGGNGKTCIFDENRPAIFADVPTLPPGTESPTYFSLHWRVSIWDAPYDTGYGLHLAK